MVALLIRTLIIYILLSITLKLMGKRQIGELEVSELVSTLLLSEIAALPIADPDIPLLYAVFPILVILCLEIFLSFLKNKFSLLQNLFENAPSVIICRGRLKQKELERMRISVQELLSELRLQGVTEIGDVEYAILESTGKLSVIQKADKQQPTRSDLNIQKKETGLAHPVIVDGAIMEKDLSNAGKSVTWLKDYCKKQGISPENIFLCTVNDAGDVTIIRKEKKG